MSPSARRILIPVLVTAVALTVILLMIFGRPRPAETTDDTETAAALIDEAGSDAAPGSVEDTDNDGTSAAESAANVTSDPVRPLEGLLARATGRTDDDQSALGSLDPNEALARIDFTRVGAGMSMLRFSDIWLTAKARHDAEAHAKALADGQADPPAMPEEVWRYQLIDTYALKNYLHGSTTFQVPALAANTVTVNGTTCNLFDYTRDANDEAIPVWGEIEPGAFQTIVEEQDGTPILRITRRFVVKDSFEMRLEQRLENLTDEALEVVWSQYGPWSLPLDRSRYMDRRRFRFGYQPDLEKHPEIVLSEDNDLLFERTTLLKRWKKAGEALAEGNPAEQQENLTLWPNEHGEKEGYGLSWFAATSRYFGFVVHPTAEQAKTDPALARIVDRIVIEVGDAPSAEARDESRTIFTHLVSPMHRIEPGTELALDMGVFAGPLDRSILAGQQPFDGLNMPKLILYQMSSFCAICTFQWLAHLLLGFLTFLHGKVLFDWGLAIIGLVVVVRTILHPLTKRSQISMQRFGKQMSEMKPEIDRLQKKYPNEPKKLQTEQMRMMRERGVNPLQMLGCLPMFLQTPIWIALYAMLYFAYDIRQEPAFFGLFQKITGGAWPFLADLSSADHFFGELAEPTRFLLWNVTGINLLPILMGVIFFVQQKYMSPPPSPTMSEDQLRQQKMMRVMMVVLFPLMLYSAPSGLTLYIMTSSLIGIFESRYVRNHIKEMDLNPPKPKAKGKKPRDAQGRAYAAAMKRQEEKRRAKKRGPEKKFKKRR